MLKGALFKGSKWEVSLGRFKATGKEKEKFIYFVQGLGGTMKVLFSIECQENYAS